MEIKIIKKLIYLISTVIFVQGCIGSAYDKKLKNGYYLSAVDVREDMHLGYLDGEYGIGIINATVFAVGQNDEFIIIKKHPRAFPNDPNRSITNYFIIPLKHKISSSPEKNILGPLTLEEFEQKKSELNINNMKFTIVFEDLE